MQHPSLESIGLYLFHGRNIIYPPKVINDLFADFINPFNDINKRYSAFSQILNFYGYKPQPSSNVLFYFANTSSDFKILKMWGLDINQPILLNGKMFYFHELIEDIPPRWIGALSQGYDLCKIGLNPRYILDNPIRSFIDINGNPVDFVIITEEGIYDANSGKFLVPYAKVNINQGLLILLEYIFLYELRSLINRNVPSGVSEDTVAKYIYDDIIETGSACIGDLRHYIPIIDRMLELTDNNAAKRKYLQAAKDAIIKRTELRPQLKQLLDLPRKGRFPGGPEYRKSMEEEFPQEIKRMIEGLDVNHPEEIIETLQLLKIDPKQFRDPQEALDYLQEYTSQL